MTQVRDVAAVEIDGLGGPDRSRAELGPPAQSALAAALLAAPSARDEPPGRQDPGRQDPGRQGPGRQGPGAGAGCEDPVQRELLREMALRALL